MQLRIERVTVQTAIERAVKLLQPRCSERGQVLKLTLPEKPLHMQGDPARLEQIFVSLLGNAIKFTPFGGHIWISLEESDHGAAYQKKSEPPRCIARVRDDGIGIAPEDLPRVFDLFMQGDRSLSRTQGGLGIGLTMVRCLVELHGGTVEAHSNGRGKGSEFVVHLPLDRPATRADHLDPAAPDGEPAEASGTEPRGDAEDKNRPRRILVVDDNADAANTMAMLLQLFSHVVEVAYNGPSALELAPSFRPELAFVDISLPGMDGYEVARRLRGQRGHKNLTLVAVSGYGRDDLVRHGEEGIFDEYLTKPIEIERLREVIAELPVRKS